MTFLSITITYSGEIHKQNLKRIRYTQTLSLSHEDRKIIFQKDPRQRKFYKLFIYIFKEKIGCFMTIPLGLKGDS